MRSWFTLPTSVVSSKMAAESEEGPQRRWYFTREQLANSPSRADGVDPEKELRYRQDAASLIQDMGPKLNLNVLCMSTAIVYMHRFYMINSFKSFDRVIIATAALFLAAKVEEHPRKLEHVAKCSYSLLHKDKSEKVELDMQSETYAKLIDDITSHELMLLQTLGFDVQVKHPHPSVVHCTNLVGVSRDLSQAAFFLAHNSQLLTTFCLEHSPTVVACMCIHLTCAWKGLEIPRSSDNRNWWEYVDTTVTCEKLEELATEFLTIVDKSPSRLKKRIQDNIRMAVDGSRPHGSHTSSGQSSRHSSAQATPSLSNYKHKDRSSHQTNKHSKPHQPKPHPHPPPATSKSQLPPPTQSNNELFNSTDIQKSRKHKEPQIKTDSSTHRIQKHPDGKDTFHHQKHKKMKPEDNSTATPHHTGHKQALTLNDYHYRQTKRQHQEGEDHIPHNKHIKLDHHKPHPSNSFKYPLPPLPPLRPNESPPPPPPPS